MCIGFKGDSNRSYVRSMDYLCLQGLSDVVIGSVFNHSEVTSDKILIDMDIKALMGSGHILKRNRKDAESMARHFSAFMAAGGESLQIAYVAVHFGSRNKELILCHGMSRKILDTHIAEAMGKASDEQVTETISLSLYIHGLSLSRFFTSTHCVPMTQGVLHPSLETAFHVFTYVRPGKVSASMCFGWGNRQSSSSLMALPLNWLHNMRYQVRLEKLSIAPQRLAGWWHRLLYIYQKSAFCMQMTT